MLFLGIVFTAVGAIFLLITLIQFLKNRSFESADTGTVNATVTQKRKYRTKNGCVYELYTEYGIDGETYKKKVNVTPQEYEAIGEGGDYQLVYQTRNPKKSIRPDDLNPKNVRILLYVSLGFLIVGLLLIVIGRNG